MAPAMAHPMPTPAAAPEENPFEAEAALVGVMVVLLLDTDELSVGDLDDVEDVKDVNDAEVVDDVAETATMPL